MASTVLLRAQAASLRRDFPGWHFIISSAGRIWAQRRKRFEVYESVDGDTAREVREKIAAREKL